jgi:hypothetical protein
MNCRSYRLVMKDSQMANEHRIRSSLQTKQIRASLIAFPKLAVRRRFGIGRHLHYLMFAPCSAFCDRVAAHVTKCSRTKCSRCSRK